MIPVRLRLRNFMPYGEEPQALEFDRFHVACLCGANGDGKSSLLDAITYALWGRARISERRDSSDDELIHLGKTEMEVEFEFELDGQRYCVIRRRTIRETARRRTSSGVLELQVRDGVRVPGLDQVSPYEALERYLESRQTPRDRLAALLERGKRLIVEVEAARHGLVASSDGVGGA